MLPHGRNLKSTGPETEAEQLLVETKEARMSTEGRGRGIGGMQELSGDHKQLLVILMRTWFPAPSETEQGGSV